MTKPIDVFDLNPQTLAPKVDPTEEKLAAVVATAMSRGKEEREGIEEWNSLFGEQSSLVSTTVDWTISKVKERLEKILSSRDPISSLRSYVYDLGDRLKK